MTDSSTKSYLKSGSELEWIQLSVFGRSYELQANGQTVARMEFPSLFSMRAKAEGRDGCWVFERSGFWNPAVEIRECDKELPMAQCERKVFGNTGTLILSKGRKLIFRINIWGTKAEFETENGELLFSMKIHGIFKYRAFVTVHEKAQAYPEAVWIPHLMWYLVLHEKRHRRAS